MSPTCLLRSGSQDILGSVLTEGSLGIVARCLEITRQRLARIIAPHRYQGLGGLRSLNGGGAHYRKQRRLDRISDTQPAEAMQVGSP